MFGMDRQLLLFKYYANLAGFEEQQSLYWYYTSNFPKATDLSKMIDKNAGAEREVKNVKERKGNPINTNVLGNERPWMKEQIEKYGSLVDIETAPATELAKKYEGYKYSISPLKQTNETILVFRKPYKTGSCLHDTLAFENGDNECRCGALNIDGNRVPTNEDLARINKDDNGMFGVGNNNNNKAQQMKEQGLEYGGRYPAQTFITSETAQVLDEQSGISKGNNSNGGGSGGIWTSGNSQQVSKGYDDIGGCSKILHKCDYEEGECDLYFYNPKVSKSERNAGCDEFPLTNENRSNAPLTHAENRQASVRNSHPTLKPIKLNKNILALFKTPSEQRIVYPFAGSGSEIIGGIKAGFNNWCGCEISQEYIDIALARIEYWSNFEGCEVPETTEVAEGQMDIWEML